MGGEAELYDEESIAFLEKLWGEGYLSPGGPEEVARILDGLSLKGKRVLDVGCGSGGITVALARDHGAAEVVGVDVEQTVCDAARLRVAKAGLGARIEIRQVEPGPFAFGDAEFDVVFSKDSIVHIPDKDFLAREAFRVLRQGGWFAASDWLIGHDGEPSPEMKRYIAAEALNFGMASPAAYERALKAAGFVDVSLRDRNPWYREVAKTELARLRGPERPAFEASLGPAAIAKQIETWEAMTVVLDTGEHRPHHFRGRKP